MEEKTPQELGIMPPTHELCPNDDPVECEVSNCKNRATHGEEWTLYTFLLCEECLTERTVKVAQNYRERTQKYEKEMYREKVREIAISATFFLSLCLYSILVPHVGVEPGEVNNPLAGIVALLSGIVFVSICIKMLFE